MQPVRLLIAFLYCEKKKRSSKRRRRRNGNDGDDEDENEEEAVEDEKGALRPLTGAAFPIPGLSRERLLRTRQKRPL